MSQFETIRPSYVTELELNKPLTLTVKSDKDLGYNLRVTPIDANHCPGSVMFLFEKLHEGKVMKRILYTGDFRFEDEKVLSRQSVLHDEHGKPLKLDEVYLDTTFLSSKFRHFPSRRAAETKIWELTKEWLSRNGKIKSRSMNKKKFVVKLHLPAQFGYENILNTIYLRSRLEWRVHVPAIKFAKYLCHNSLQDSTDSDLNEAEFVHACETRSPPNFEKCPNTLNCLPEARNLQILHIKASAMFFDDNVGDEDVVYSLVSSSKDCERYRICYSTHSSLTEIQSFLRHYAPVKVIPSVIPTDGDKDKVQRIIDDMLESVGKDGSCSKLGDSQDDISKVEMVRKVKKRDGEEVNHLSESKCSKLNDSFSLLEESPKKVECFDIESSDDNLDDTPDIEDLIKEAEHKGWPEFAKKSLKEYKRRKDEVIVIDD